MARPPSSCRYCRAVASGRQRRGPAAGARNPGAILPVMERLDVARAYLAPARFIDSDAENVVAFSLRARGDESDQIAQAVHLYYAVRDGIAYTPYCDFRSPETYRASACLARGSGFCVAKSALLAAAARAARIPARVGFADVRNHLSSRRLRALMGTDVFYYHGYTELHLGGVRVNATPP